MGNEANPLTFHVEITTREREKITETFKVQSASTLRDQILERVGLSKKHYHVEYVKNGSNFYLHSEVIIYNLPRILKTRVKLYPITPKEFRRNKKGRKVKELRKENVRILTNKQEVPTVLGNGTYGVVYLGKYDNMQVAVKILKMEDQQEKELIKKEVGIMEKNDHPNVLKCYGLFFEKNEIKQDEAYVVMELCSCGDLFHNLHRKGGILNNATDVELVNVMLQVASGVQYLHQKGIIHRDIKSSNILLSWNTWKISDFGTYKLSRSLRGKTIHGTPEYLAPEILNVYDRQITDYTHVVDIYSLGILFWEIWTRERILSTYFKKYKDIISSNPMKFVSFLHKNEIRPSMSEKFMRPGCPEELKTLISKCWSKSPEERPQSMEIVVSELKRVRSEIVSRWKR